MKSLNAIKIKCRWRNLDTVIFVGNNRNKGLSMFSMKDTRFLCLIILEKAEQNIYKPFLPKNVEFPHISFMTDRSYLQRKKARFRKQYFFNKTRKLFKLIFHGNVFCATIPQMILMNCLAKNMCCRKNSSNHFEIFLGNEFKA